MEHAQSIEGLACQLLMLLLLEQAGGLIRKDELERQYCGLLDAHGSAVTAIQRTNFQEALFCIGGDDGKGAC